LLLQELGAREVITNSSGAHLSSDGGALMLRSWIAVLVLDRNARLAEMIPASLAAAGFRRRTWGATNCASGWPRPRIGSWQGCGAWDCAGANWRPQSPKNLSAADTQKTVHRISLISVRRAFRLRTA
jgi:hypothetical protein